MKKVIFFAALVMLLASCHNKSKQYAYLLDRPVPAQIEVVGLNSSSVTNTYMGEINAKASIPLVFPLGGELTSIQVKSGEKVHEGQVIATVDNTQAKAMLESAEAMLAQAKDAYARLKPVHEKGGISDVKWVEMETNLQKAQSMVISSRKRYEDCTLRASQKGIVDLHDVETGQYLTVGQSIGSLLDLSGRKTVFTVPENEIGALTHGDDIIVYLPALNETFAAKVEEKSLTATHLAHTYKVTAQILENNKSAKQGNNKSNIDDLLPGMVCRVLISNKKIKGYIISSGCVQTQQNGHTVWLLRNGRTTRRHIKIADFVENGVLISEGLQLGDTIISKGYQKMYEGARIKVKS